MKPLTQAAVVIAFMAASLSMPLHAQESYEKVNSNLAAIVSVPLDPTAKYVHTGWGLVGGGGYNFNSHHSAIVEFMWDRLSATNGALDTIRGTSYPDIRGFSNLYALTGNYRFESQGKKFGTYFIGGGGLYYRTTNLSKLVVSGTGTSCSPAWLWWGFNCASGIVIANQRIGSIGSNAFGVNGGIGFTARVGEEPWRVYVESRYHYAPTKNFSTQLITLTLGIRY
jgi:hypothetical protein